MCTIAYHIIGTASLRDGLLLPGAEHLALLVVLLLVVAHLLEGPDMHKRMCVYIYIYIYTYIHMYVYMYMYMYMYVSMYYYH